MAIVESNVLAQLRKFDSATLFNAVCELSGEPNLDYTDHTIRCLLPGLGPAIGYAITAEFSTNDADSTTLPWHEYYEQMEASEGPLIAAIRDVDSRPGRGASLGDGMATIFKRFGVVGSIVQGTVRDLKGISEVGLPVWSWGAVPGHGAFGLVRYDIPISVGQMRVRPGDLLFADGDGCTRIPTENVDDILATAQSIAEREAKDRAKFASADFRAAHLRQ